MRIFWRFMNNFFHIKSTIKPTIFFLNLLASAKLLHFNI